MVAVQMDKTRIMVVSGFLGSGKTTSMLALSKHIDSKIGKACIITNDLGANLVDTNYSMKSTCSITEIPSGCICYQMDNVVDKFRRLKKKHKPNIIMSDIPGCGIGALDHVYHTLNKEYSEEFELAPFTVITDPERLKMIMPENTDINLPSELKYLLTTQLEEADLVVLNKIDLLSKDEIEKYLSFLKKICPNTNVIAISAKNEDNMAEFAALVLKNNAQLKVITIDQDKFVAAENLLSWYNRRFTVETLDKKEKPLTPFIEDLIESIRAKLKQNDGNVPHLKIFANNDEDFLKVSLIGVDYEAEFARKLEKNTRNLRVIINARATINSKALNKIMDEALDETAKAYKLDVNVFSTESFGVMDPK